MTEEYGSCWTIDCTNDPHFKRYHDATRFGVLACDVLDFTFDVSKTSKG